MAMGDVKCRFCQQTKFIKKHGKGDAGHQRYRCLSCNRTGNENADAHLELSQFFSPTQFIDKTDTSLLPLPPRFLQKKGGIH